MGKNRLLKKKKENEKRTILDNGLPSMTTARIACKHTLTPAADVCIMGEDNFIKTMVSICNPRPINPVSP